MISDFLIGSAAGTVVMLIHLVSTLIVYGLVHGLGKKINEGKVSFLIISLIGLYIILFMCLCISVTIWASTFYYMDLVDNFGDAFYTAMLNYTTLGAGDLNQMAATRLFGPMAAASGILMFGWTAALIVYIIQLHLPVILKNKWGK